MVSGHASLAHPLLLGTLKSEEEEVLGNTNHLGRKLFTSAVCEYSDDRMYIVHMHALRPRKAEIKASALRRTFHVGDTLDVDKR